MALEVTETNFNVEVASSPIPVIVDFYAVWCGPCQQMAPIIDNLQKANEGVVKFVKVNIDQARDLAIRFGVTSLPTFVFFKDGEPLNQEVGFIPEEAFQNLVNEFVEQ